MYVIVTNNVNNLPSDRENSGNLKMQFVWVPCIKTSKPVYLKTQHVHSNPVTLSFSPAPKRRSGCGEDASLSQAILPLVPAGGSAPATSEELNMPVSRQSLRLCCLLPNHARNMAVQSQRFDYQNNNLLQGSHRDWKIWD